MPAPPPILIIEDDPAQVAILERVLRKARLANPIQVASTRDAAERYLADEQSAVPVLVLLDLYLPDGSGLELIALIRSSHDAIELPILVLSGSQAADDIDQAFEIGANSYLVKPVAFAALIDTLENLSLPWAILPPSALEGPEAS